MGRHVDLLPIWSFPLILALLGLVLCVGKFPAIFQFGIGVESLLYLGYVLWRTRRPSFRSNAVARLLPLFPGHLLLLFAIGLVPGTSSELTAAWMVIPAATVCYDVLTPWGRTRTRAWSILAGLYVIIWADLFYLLERVIALGRALERSAELSLAIVFGVLGAVFLSVGTYRHWRWRPH